MVVAGDLGGSDCLLPGSGKRAPKQGHGHAHNWHAYASRACAVAVMMSLVTKLAVCGTVMYIIVLPYRVRDSKNEHSDLNQFQLHAFMDIRTFNHIVVVFSPPIDFEWLSRVPLTS